MSLTQLTRDSVLQLAGVFAAMFALWLFFIALKSCLEHKFVSTVAFRHMRTRGISYVAMGLIMSLVVMYLLVISVLEGFKAHYMDKLQSILAHATIGVGNLAWGIEFPEKWADEISKTDPGIKGVSIGVETPAMAFMGNARTVGTLRGIDLDRELKFGRIGEILVPKNLTEFGFHQDRGNKLPGCILGGAWRKTYHVKPGDRVTFLFSNEDSEPRSVGFQVVGFFDGNNPFLEQGAYVDRRHLAELLKVDNMAKTLFVWLKDPERPDLAELRAHLITRMKELISRDAPEHPKHVNGVEIETWQEQQGNFYHAMTRENMMMRFIMGVFLVLVAFILYLIFGRLVAEKVRDIGALRAIGANPAGVRGCFLMQGFFIGAFGVGLGLLMAYIMITNINTIASAMGVDPFPNDSFGVDKIPTHTLPWDIYLISGLTLLSALIGALVPAVRASKMNPVECLRQE